MSTDDDLRHSLRSAFHDLRAAQDLAEAPPGPSAGPAPDMPPEAVLALRRAAVARRLREAADALGRSLTWEEALADAEQMLPARPAEIEARIAAWSERLGDVTESDDDGGSG